MKPAERLNTLVRFLTFAFGNRIALTVDSVNIEATDASALPTHSRSSWGPHNVHVMYKLIYTSSASAYGICVKNISYEYTLCVVSRILAEARFIEWFGEHLRTVRRTFEVIWCIIAAIADMVSVDMMTNLSLLK